MNTEIYWAKQDLDELSKEMDSKIDDYYTFLTESGRMDLWRASYKRYYDGVYNYEVRHSGDQGQFRELAPNHYRNILQNLLVMTTSQRPSFDPKATNTDYKSMAQTLVAESVIDYYIREKRLEQDLRDAVEYSIVTGEGWVKIEWDESLGELIGTNDEDGTTIMSGDLKYKSYMPDDIIRDIHTKSIDDCNWFIVRDEVSKWDLIARFPDFEEEIMESVESVSDDADDFTEQIVDMTLDNRHGNEMDTDLVFTYTLYHRKTSSLPLGREVLYIKGGPILMDIDLSTDDIPVYYIAPHTQSKIPFGYTIGFDLLPIQESISALYSTVLTNQRTFGVQNVIAPKGANVNATSLSGGLRLIEYAGDTPPAPFNLTKTPPEIFNFMTILERTMEFISGVNSVTRGQPEASLKSGTALAMVQAMAVQFASGLQNSYVRLLEDAGTAIIDYVKAYASHPRIITVAGKSNRSYLREFTSEDVSDISRVLVDVGNPVARTIAGRINLAESLLQSGIIQDPNKYIEVLNTGKIEPMLEGATSEIMLIRSENETMQNGQMTRVIITDNHQQHIMEHKSLLASPEARLNDDLAMIVLQHIEQHILALKNGDKELFALLGQQPLPSDNPAPNMPPQPPESKDLGDISNTPPAGPGVPLPNMPNMPNIPGNAPPNIQDAASQVQAPPQADSEVIQ